MLAFFFIALPSIVSTNRYIRAFNHSVNEGILRCEELLLYLKSRNLPLVVSLSEDATRIVGRVQYDSKTNQLMGFALPLNTENGLPVPFTYKARSSREIVAHFTSNNPVAGFINVIMARPITDKPVASFCLLLFCSNNTYSAGDVSRRWSTTVNELKKLKIKVLTVSSDSDPKYNSCMRRMSQMHELTNINWAEFVSELYQYPFFVQDTTHIATKLRNFLLRTLTNPTKLLFGKYYISLEHLIILIDMFSKDKHNLTMHTLNPADRQNFESVIRMTDGKVIELLRSSVINSQGTVKFLEIIRNIIDSFMDRNLEPIKRIEKMWYSVLMLRIWRKFVLSQKKLTLKDNFLTNNCYTCIELNAQSLIMLMINLKNDKMDSSFLPYYFDSQPCESLFRSVRSFTSTYSTVANCTVKEAISRITKIQLQSEISANNPAFVFPRLGADKKKLKTFELPTKEEIQHQIEICKKHAVEDAVNLGLINKAQAKRKNIFESDMKSLDEGKQKTKNPRSIRMKLFEKNMDKKNEFKKVMMQLKINSLKDYSNNLKNNIIDDTSPYVKIDCTNGMKVIKKTTLCWLLRPEIQKLSSDRLLRVRADINNKKLSKKPSKKHLHYSQLSENKIQLKKLNRK